MKDPMHVTKLVRAIHDGVDGTLPVTVKCRIGLHDGNATPFSAQDYQQRTKSSQEEYEKLVRFVDTIASDGICTDFQIHARIAVLGGKVSPADNRKIPPLKYEYAHRLAKEFPELNFVLNGGISSLTQAREELTTNGKEDNGSKLVGVMVGRGLVANPWGFAMADEVLYGDTTTNRQQPQNRRQLLQAYGRHADHEERHSDEPAVIRRSLVAACAHIFAGEANAKKFRMDLDEIAGRPEQLEREARAAVWSSGGAPAAGGGGKSKVSSLASAFSTAPVVLPATGGGAWDTMQAKDDARPSWDENEPPLSELILEAAQKHFGDEVLNHSRKESYDKMAWEEEEACRRRSNGDTMLFVTGGQNDEKVSGGVVDGWFNSLQDAAMQKA